MEDNNPKHTVIHTIWRCGVEHFVNNNEPLNSHHSGTGASDVEVCVLHKNIGPSVALFLGCLLLYAQFTSTAGSGS